MGISYITKESHDINWKFEVMPNFFTIGNVHIFTTGKVIFFEGGGRRKGYV
jgi:hypothetical protein